MLRNQLYLAAWVSLLLPACIDDNDSNNTTTTTATGQAVTSRADTIVTPGLARAIAETYERPRQVASSSVALDANQRVAMYGFNFVGGGWVIVGGDFEYQPILAYNDTGTIDVSMADSAFTVWRTSAIEVIEAIRGGSASDDPARQADVETARDTRAGWLGLLAGVSSRADVDRGEIARGHAIAELVTCVGDVCQPPTIPYCTVIGDDVSGPRLTTEWNQDCVYNSMMPADPFASYYYCGKMPAGCSPVAAAQVIKYYGWNKPDPFIGTFDFASMPDHQHGTSQGESQRATLIFALGLTAQTTYAHDGSYTSTTKLRNALTNDFGYATTKGAYTAPFATIHPQVMYGHPVLIGGTNSDGDGHMWVADGTKRKLLDEEPCTARGSEKTKYIHYNWGWGGQSNGWFSETNFNGFTSNRSYVTMVPAP